MIKNNEQALGPIHYPAFVYIIFPLRRRKLYFVKFKTMLPTPFISYIAQYMHVNSHFITKREGLTVLLNNDLYSDAITTDSTIGT